VEINPARPAATAIHNSQDPPPSICAPLRGRESAVGGGGTKTSIRVQSTGSPTRRALPLAGGGGGWPPGTMTQEDQARARACVRDRVRDRDTDRDRDRGRGIGYLTTRAPNRYETMATSAHATDGEGIGMCNRCVSDLSCAALNLATPVYKLACPHLPYLFDAKPGRVTVHGASSSVAFSTCDSMLGWLGDTFEHVRLAARAGAMAMLEPDDASGDPDADTGLRTPWKLGMTYASEWWLAVFGLNDDVRVRVLVPKRSNGVGYVESRHRVTGENRRWTNLLAIERAFGLAAMAYLALNKPCAATERMWEWATNALESKHHSALRVSLHAAAVRYAVDKLNPALTGRAGRRCAQAACALRHPRAYMLGAALFVRVGADLAAGVAYRLAGNLRKSERALVRALALCPRDVSAWLSLTVTYHARAGEAATEFAVHALFFAERARETSDSEASATAAAASGGTALFRDYLARACQTFACSCTKEGVRGKDPDSIIHGLSEVESRMRIALTGPPTEYTMLHACEVCRAPTTLRCPCKRAAFCSNICHTEGWRAHRASHRHHVAATA
jgi:hypothetical protein